MRRTASGMVMPWSSLDIMPDRSKGLLVWNQVSGRCSLNPERADSGRGSTVSPAASQMSALCTVLPPPPQMIPTLGPWGLSIKRSATAISVISSMVSAQIAPAWVTAERHICVDPAREAV